MDECLESNGGCQHVCHDTEGSFTCSCNDGYALAEDELACDSKYIHKRLKCVTASSELDDK